MTPSPNTPPGTSTPTHPPVLPQARERGHTEAIDADVHVSRADTENVAQQLTFTPERSERSQDGPGCRGSKDRQQGYGGSRGASVGPAVDCGPLSPRRGGTRTREESAARIGSSESLKWTNHALGLSRRRGQAGHSWTDVPSLTLLSRSHAKNDRTTRRTSACWVSCSENFAREGLT